jgi:hypothetical protein
MTSSLVVGLQGALTTVFTPAASCLPFNDSLKITFVNNTFFHQYHIHTECQPPSATIGGYFSPAVCPSGYNRAPGSLHSIVLRELKDNINSEIQSDVSSTRIAVGESVDFCCPAGYDANPMNNCISAMDGQTAIAMGVAPHLTVTGKVTGIAIADMVQVRFQQTDKLPAPTFYPSPSASSFSSTSTPIPTAIAVATLIASHSLDNSVHNRKVTVIVCSGIAAILVLAFVIVVWILIRHGRKTRKVGPRDDPPPYSLTDDLERDVMAKEHDSETATSDFDRTEG